MANSTEGEAKTSNSSIYIDQVYNERRGRSTKVVYSITIDALDEEEYDQFAIPGFADVRIKFRSQLDKSTLQVFIKSKKEESKRNFMVKLNVTCKDLNFFKQLVCPDCPEHWTAYTDMGFLKPFSIGREFVMDLTLVVAQAVQKPATLWCGMLYDDTTFTDFHLVTEEGSVPVHRACLAAHSKVFKAMLSGDWKEATNGCLHIKGLQISLQTLKDLKEYMYLGTLPEEGLRTLLLIADYYMINHLKEECIWQLASTVTADNLMDLLEFASSNKRADLTSAILQVTPDNVVDSLYSRGAPGNVEKQIDKNSQQL